MAEQLVDYGDNLVAFSWMNLEFFEQVIRGYEKDPSAIVHNFKVSPGSQPGENFSTVVFRVKLEFSSKSGNNQEISMILKTVSEKDGLKKDLMESNRNFETEIEMYEKVLPEVRNLWDFAGDEPVLFPRLVCF
jgi:hypothetical protein